LNFPKQFLLLQEGPLKIVACVKQVPDTAAKVTVDNGKVSWGDSPLVINPWDEYAVEAALQMKEAQGGTVTAVTIGGPASVDALKHALAMGCDDAILINDPALEVLDTQSAARVLAAVVKKIDAVDLVFFGKEAVDGNSGIVASQTARLLGYASLTLASVVKFENGTLRVERTTEEGRQVVTSKLPAAMSIAKDFGEPRYPSFMGIRKASKATIPTWTLADLGISTPGVVVTTLEILNPPSREVNCEILSGTPGEAAEKLVEKILGEKVL
jgi:electron transfer flavoprotein beta subunit